ncbi:cobalt/nickel transport system permease protein [Tumebacillus sp. BK434]|uniref:energy-coupling factor ABC transporter permease n=1 Tax=Tumebacillus sp. BK434 TaxID=2512169 RepID=UPI001047FA4C|nr:energy-coupling factor ABC transporter permease [Tumebacillus sp. BK434]TCP52623.1 cobalt/nickel transport system permease protein [Tumebacillus sp. BK434]
MKLRTCIPVLVTFALTLYLYLNSAESAYAMHIMEGFLSPGWSLFWWAVFLPFFVLGLRALVKITKEAPQLKLMLGLAGAFTFVLSALKLPSVTGSSSHPTGVGLGTVMFGPLPMSVIGSIVLLFQAVLLAHGGLTTLGANAFSMAVVGPFVGYFFFKLVLKATGKLKLAIFAAAMLADLSTYVMTSIQLALAFPSEAGGFAASLAKFAGIFAVTQIPLAISEGLLTVLVWNWLQSFNSEELSLLKRTMKGVAR